MNTEWHQLEIPFLFKASESKKEPVATSEMGALPDFDPLNRVTVKQFQGMDPSNEDAKGVGANQYFPAVYSDKESRFSKDLEDASPSSESMPAKDIVAIYLSEIGKQPLLSREDEVELGRQFEAGTNDVTGALAQIPLIVNQTLKLFDNFEVGKLSLSDVALGVFGDNTESINSADEDALNKNGISN